MLLLSSSNVGDLTYLKENILEASNLMNEVTIKSPVSWDKNWDTDFLKPDVIQVHILVDRALAVYIHGIEKISIIEEEVWPIDVVRMIISQWMKWWFMKYL